MWSTGKDWKSKMRNPASIVGEISLVAALSLFLLSACAGAAPLTAKEEAAPPEGATLERNLMDLYGGETADQLRTDAPATVVKPRTVTDEIDKVPAFAKVFGDDDLAIVIGIEEYKNLPPVEYATNDAESMRSYLEALGFAPRNTRFLVNGDATESAIRVAVERWAVNAVKPESRVFFFYSGHGAPEPDKGDAYLVPYDGDPQYLADTAFSLQRLYDDLGRLPARSVIVMVDACFSGSGPRSVMARGVRSIALRKKEKRPANLAILTATSERQIATSFPEKQHGLFSYELLSALHSGEKTVPEIFGYVEKRVADEARRQNVSQTPVLLMPEGADPELFRLAR